MQSRFSTRAVVEAGVAVALAYVLSEIKLFQMPQGGDVTAGGMIPIIFVALRHGTPTGLLAGLALGLLKLFIGGYVVHPVQALLDYPVAFALLGLAGLTPRQPWLGTLVGMFGRFVAHVLSGVVFFAEYAGDQNVWVYSIAYNGTYMLPELVVGAVLLTLLFMHPAMSALRVRQPGA